MARKKQSRAADQTSRADAAQTTPPPRSTPRKESAPTEADELRISLRDYILLNLFFDVFCVVQLVLVRLFIRETRGMYFFFILLMLGFLIVSVFDFFYERALDDKLAGSASRS
jgi:hypothetical protein